MLNSSIRATSSLGLRLSLPFAALLLTACPDFTKPKPATQVLVVQGTGQTAVAGAAVAIAPTIKVADEDGKGVGDKPYSFAVTGGGGTITVATGTTNAEGLGTPGVWTLGKTSGANALTAVVEGVGVPVAFTATGVAGPASTITAQAGANQTAAPSATIATPPSVKLVDANNNVVSGATVTFAVTAGGGSITGATQTTNASGVATVGSWTLGTAPGVNTLTATTAGVTVLQISATAVPPATKLALATQPANATTGEIINTQPVVRILDANNNISTTSSAVVTAAIASGTGSLSGTTTVTAASGTASFTNLVVTGTSPVTLGFSSPGLTSVVSNSFTPQAPTFNLVIERVYITQGTQNLAGDVPLVAGRAGLLRVFARATAANTQSPDVRVRTYQGTTLFRTYTIPAPSAGVPTLMDESNLLSTWNLQLPAADIVANMKILADVDPANTVTESSDADNSFPSSGVPLTLDVRTVPTMKIMFVPITQPGGATGNINAGNVDAWLDYSRRVYPFAATDVVIHSPYTYSSVLNGASYDASWTTLLNQLDALRITEGILDRYYYGVAKPTYTSGGTGFGRFGVPVAVGMDFTGTVQPNTNYYSMTLAHEWGHNFNRRHIACGNPSNTDLNYPYDPLTSVGSYGYDLSLGVLRAPNAYKEFMSYCQPLWISDYTYKAVIEWRATRFDPPPAVAQPGLLVWGRIGPNGIVLEPSFAVDAPPSLPTKGGPYSVHATDEQGRPVFSISFEGGEIDHAPDERTFAFVVPMPATRAQPATMRLMSGSRELARRSRPPGSSLVDASSALTSTRLRTLGGSRARLEWNAQSFPMAMVRDPATGQVLGFFSGGAGDLTVQRPDVDVLFSDGVTSVKKRVPIAPR